jgi:hypothetical protein
MLDPVMLLDYAGPVAAATVAVIIGKSLARTAGSLPPARTRARRCASA